MAILHHKIHGFFSSKSMPFLLVGVLAIAGLPGCGNAPDALDAGDLSSKSDSLFGISSVQARAVIITKGQVPYPLESLAIHGSPASDVRQALGPVLTRLNQAIGDAQAAIDATDAELGRAKDELAKVTAEIDAEHQDRLPDDSDKPSLNQRNAVKLLEKWRAQEIAANNWHEEETTRCVTPIRGTMASLEGERQGLHSKAFNLRMSFQDEVFQGLPSKPRKIWKTNSNGLVSLDVPNSEPWIVWAASSRRLPGGQTERYRWICRLPDDLDSNGGLFLDNANLLDERGLVTGIFDESLVEPPTFLERSTSAP